MKHSTAQKKNGTNATIPQAKLAKTESGNQTVIEESQTAAELTEAPATLTGPILEALLRNEAGYEHWGLNE